MNIGILQLGTFGDLILCTPILSELKRKFPYSKIYYIVGRRNQQVLWNNPFVDELIVWDKSFSKILTTIHSLKKSKFDYYVDPKDHFSRESLLIAHLIKANTKIGYNGKIKVFDIEIPYSIANHKLHFTQRIFQAFETFGISTPTINNIPKPQLFPSNDSKRYVAEFLLSSKVDKFIVWNISASNPNKMLSENILVATFKECSYPNNLRIVLTYTPKHKNIALKIKSACPDFCIFASRDFLDVAALVEQSIGVITPDTAMVHVASAFDKPLLAFYSGLDDFYDKFFPINRRSIIIRAKPGDFGIQSITLPQIIDSLTTFVKNYVAV